MTLGETSENVEPWWSLRRVYWRIVGTPPEPEFQILHLVGRAPTAYRKSVRDDVVFEYRGRQAEHVKRVFWPTIQRLWDLGFIAGSRADVTLDQATDYRITTRGRRVLAAWTHMAGGKRWRERDLARHARVQRWRQRYRHRDVACESKRKG